MKWNEPLVNLQVGFESIPCNLYWYSGLAYITQNEPLCKVLYLLMNLAVTYLDRIFSYLIKSMQSIKVKHSLIILLYCNILICNIKKTWIVFSFTIFLSLQLYEMEEVLKRESSSLTKEQFMYEVGLQVWNAGFVKRGSRSL